VAPRTAQYPPELLLEPPLLAPPLPDMSPHAEVVNATAPSATTIHRVVTNRVIFMGYLRWVRALQPASGIAS